MRHHRGDYVCTCSSVETGQPFELEVSFIEVKICDEGRITTPLCISSDEGRLDDVRTFHNFLHMGPIRAEDRNPTESTESTEVSDGTDAAGVGGEGGGITGQGAE